ncbi:MAG TPA: PfkB family carbohydrate kinase [Myxococcota bacterium]|nr:PfkB family carbohydrate kinase [Myxococcota bacterium]
MRQPMEAGVEIVGLGHANIDFLGVVDRYPEVDQKVDLGTFSIQGGGPVATALVTAATLGRRTAFIGKVGDDYFGDFIAAGLRDAGVDVSGLVREPDVVSPFSFIAVEARTGRRNVFSTGGSVGALRPAEVPPGLLMGARMLHLDGHHPEAAVAAAETARRRGMKVVLDSGSSRKGMGDLIALCDVLVASERFANEMAPRGELPEQVASLRAMGPPIVVITLGAYGAVGGDGGARLVSMGAMPVQAADTTGAGDVYHGAFLHAMLEGWDLARAMRFAAAAAGLSCRGLGGRGAIPTRADIDQALASWEGDR